jgi:polyhydroxybutyrate depolymerase
MSLGCGMAPPSNDKTTGYVEHELALNTCPGTCNWPCEAGTAGCATDPEPPTCLSPCFAPGGIASVTSTDGVHSFAKREYGLQLPAKYDTTKTYPIMLKGGGCDDPSPGGGFTVAAAAAENAAVIAVGLQFVDATQDDAGNPRGEYPRCFADGASVCTALPQNLPLCVNNPEIAYVNAVIADVESKYCVAKNQVFIGGYSSGAWEAMTMGCAMADEVRAIATVFGGLRLHRPACDGPVADLMVTGTADSTNPIGPLIPNMQYPATGAPLLTATAVNATISYLDSYGSAPERDDILSRNACVGTATEMYDPGYPQCLKYTGCPTNYPVVWCPLIGVTHGYELATSNGVDYVLGSAANPLLLGFLQSLPPL